jgi:hypothetical protein
LIHFNGVSWTTLGRIKALKQFGAVVRNEDDKMPAGCQAAELANGASWA